MSFISCNFMQAIITDMAAVTPYWYDGTFGKASVTPGLPNLPVIVTDFP